MKHINTRLLPMAYPIGANMRNNYDYFITLASKLFEVGNKRFEKIKHVCYVCTGIIGSYCCYYILFRDH